MYFKIIFKEYAKIFLTIFVSLILFFVFIDFMLVRQKLPDSANLQFLYLFYKSTEASFLLYPLSLIFAVLGLVFGMLKKNEIVAFMSLGYSFKKLLLPILTFVLLVNILFLGLQFTNVSSFASKGYAILNGKYFKHTNEHMFFKFNNNVVYIQKLDIFKKVAYGVRVYLFDNKGVLKTYELKQMKFQNNIWYATNVVETYIKGGKVFHKVVAIDLLKGFKPDILNKLESKSSMSLKMAIEALYLLNKEHIDTNFIKTYIYYTIIPPLSFILLAIILFLNAPIHSRISNQALYGGVGLFSSVILWGMFLIVKKMALSNILSPDIVFFVPFLILLGITIYYFRKI